MWSIGREISLEAGVYKVGAGARNLVKQLEGNGDDDEGVDFAWILFTGDVVYKIVGRFTNNKWYLTVRRYISFIPNHFLFVTVNENARVRSVPLSVNQDEVSHGEKWVSPKTVLGEDPPAAELRELPGAEIHGYLGPVPRERSYDTPFRQRTGSVVMSKTDSQGVLGGKEFPQFILDSDPLIGSIDQAPFGLNDKEDAKMSSLIVSGRTESFSPGGSTVVMFNISVALHQLNSNQFSQPE